VAGTADAPMRTAGATGTADAPMWTAGVTGTADVFGPEAIHWSSTLAGALRVVELCCQAPDGVGGYCWTDCRRLSSIRRSVREPSAVQKPQQVHQC
jgi:hypothetical protein